MKPAAYNPRPSLRTPADRARVTGLLTRAGWRLDSRGHEWHPPEVALPTYPGPEVHTGRCLVEAALHLANRQAQAFLEPRGWTLAHADTFGEGDDWQYVKLVRDPQVAGAGKYCTIRTALEREASRKNLTRSPYLTASGWALTRARRGWQDPLTGDLLHSSVAVERQLLRDLQPGLAAEGWSLAGGQLGPSGEWLTGQVLQHENPGRGVPPRQVFRKVLETIARHGGTTSCAFELVPILRARGLAVVGPKIRVPPGSPLLLAQLARTYRWGLKHLAGRPA